MVLLVKVVMATSMEKTLDRMAKDVFCDFLTIAVHTLLHSRQVYPVGAFKLRQKFNIPVQVCYHPEVFEYVSGIVTSVSNVLQEGKLHAVHFFVGTPGSDWEQVTMRLLAFTSVTTQTQLNNLGESLKSCLLKLSIIETYLPRRVSGDITWRIEIDADSSQMKANQTEWMKTECEGKPNSLVHGGKMTALKTATTDCMKLEMLVTRLE